MSLEDKIPDHSAFSRAGNERFRDSDIFRRVFERVVSACMAAGLVGGKGYAVDASLIEADANKSRSFRVRNGMQRTSIQKQPAVPPRNIWRRSMMQPTARRVPSRQSSSRRRTPLHNGLAR